MAKVSLTSADFTTRELLYSNRVWARNATHYEGTYSWGQTTGGSDYDVLVCDHADAAALTDTIIRSHWRYSSSAEPLLLLRSSQEDPGVEEIQNCFYMWHVGGNAFVYKRINGTDYIFGFGPFAITNNQWYEIYFKLSTSGGNDTAIVKMRQAGGAWSTPVNQARAVDFQGATISSGTFGVGSAYIAPGTYAYHDITQVSREV